MPISKEDDMSSWEQYHIILLSHIVMYRIWSLLDSYKTLVVTRVSPPIFGLKHCCRLRLNLVSLLRLNLLSHIVTYRIWSLLDSDKTLVVTRVYPPIFGLKHCCRLRLNLVSFSSISLSSAVYISSFVFSPSAYVDPYWLVLVS